MIVWAADHIVVGAGGVLAPVLTRGHVVGAIDEGGLDQRGGRVNAVGDGVEFAHDRAGPRRQGCGHRSATAVAVPVVVDSPQRVGRAGLVAGRDDVAARRDDVRLEPTVIHRPPAGESDHATGIVGQAVVTDGVGGIVGGPARTPGGTGSAGIIATAQAMVLRRAYGDDVLGPGRHTHRVLVHDAVRVAVRAVVAGSKEHHHVRVVPDKAIRLAGEGVVGAGDGVVAPGIGVDPHAGVVVVHHPIVVVVGIGIGETGPVGAKAPGPQKCLGSYAGVGARVGVGAGYSPVHHAAAEHRTSHVRAVGVIVLPGTAGAAAPGTLIEEAPKVGVHRGFVTRTHAGITDDDDLARAVEPQLGLHAVLVKDKRAAGDLVMQARRGPGLNPGDAAQPGNGGDGSGREFHFE